MITVDEVVRDPKPPARGSSHMGRGRAKAKQTKVARRLKYSGPDTDLQALANELRGEPGDPGEPLDHEDEPDEDGPYAHYADDDSER